MSKAIKKKAPVDLDFTLRRVFGKTSFRFVVAVAILQHKMLTEIDPFSERSSLRHSKVMMSLFRLVRIEASVPHSVVIGLVANPPQPPLSVKVFAISYRQSSTMASQ